MNSKLRLLAIAGLFTTSAVQAQVFPVNDIMVNGSKDNRVNLVFLPDGYQSAQLPQFVIDVTGINAYIFGATSAQTPFKQYAKFFNVYAVGVPSTDAGATHPGTAGDEPVPAIPVTVANTYFSATFDNAGVHRGIFAKNSTAIYSVLNANTPDYDVPFVLSSTTVYGGTGGAYITSTMNNSSNEIAVHELGHTFGKLNDEYYGYPRESPNMTQNNNTSTIIWKNWLPATGGSGIGVYPYGTKTPESTWFRPHQNCKMQLLGSPLCAVCKENIIDRIYEKVRPIDAYSPDTVNNVPSSPTTPLTFKFTPVLPSPNTVKFQWLLNGVVINTTDTSVQISESQLNMGNNILMAVMLDTTLLSRSNLPGNGYMFSVHWTIRYDFNTSISSVNADNKFVYKLYPVPAKGNFNLQCTNNTSATTADYQVTSITGSIISKGNVALAKGDQTIPFNVSGIAPGMYNFTLLGDGLYVTTKLVIE